MSRAGRIVAATLATLGTMPAACDGQTVDRSDARQPAAAAARPSETGDTPIRIIMGDTILPARLNGSAPARAFAAQLPLTLKLEDFHATEKIGFLPRRLSKAGAATGVTPRVGALTYYAPWGNLAIFYRDFDYSDDLLPLGMIESDLGALRRPGNVTVRIELVGVPAPR